MLQRVVYLTDGAIGTTVLSTPPLYAARNPDGSYATSYTLHFDDGTSQNIIYNNALAFGEGIQIPWINLVLLAAFLPPLILLNLQFKTSFNTDINIFNNNKFSPSYISVNPSAGRSYSSTNISWINEKHGNI